MAMAGETTDPTSHAAGSYKLEPRIYELERQNRKLADQNRLIQQQLNDQATEIGALKQQLQASAAPVQDLQQEVPKVKQQVAKIEKQEKSVPFSVGFRTGWAESPFDMPGGYFYGAFLNDRLLTQEDGIPYGDVSGELMTGVILGNHATTSGNLATIAGLHKGPASSWLTTIEMEPTVQYHLDLASVGLGSLKALRPYALAGPGMWISLLSTPVVNTSGPGARFRHTDADFQPGGVYGLGFNVRLGDLMSVAPIEGVLDKTALGAEWRYNEMANGEQFQQYTGSLSFGW
ncbi:MAG: hypothetical protein WA005_08865 [Candidatus Binataceae bacterium]